jgi:hypothetical protein
VGEFDETFDLSDSQSWKALVQFFDGLAQVKAADDGVGEDAGAAYDWPSGNFAGDLFDEFAGCPVDLEIGVRGCHRSNPRFDRSPFAAVLSWKLGEFTRMREIFPSLSRMQSQHFGAHYLAERHSTFIA